MANRSVGVSRRRMRGLHVLLAVSQTLLLLSACDVVPSTPETPPLIETIRRRDRAEVERLIRTEGLSSAIAAGNESPLFVAVAVQDIEIVELLVDAGADPGMRLANGMTDGGYDLRRTWVIPTGQSARATEAQQGFAEPDVTQPGTSTRGVSAISAPVTTPASQAGRGGWVPSVRIWRHSSSVSRGVSAGCQNS